jgi:hypothetical protein
MNVGRWIWRSQWTLVVSLAMSLGFGALGGIASSAQTAPSGASPAERTTTKQAAIHGTVKIGTLPLQSVRVTASDARTGKQVTTTTDGNGAYSLTLPRGERFLIRAERFGYEPSSTELLLNTGKKQVDFSLKSGHLHHWFNTAAFSTDFARPVIRHGRTQFDSRPWRRQSEPVAVTNHCSARREDPGVPHLREQRPQRRSICGREHPV